MKALILNSGLGSRMGVLTSEHPKCMTEISPRETILSRQLNQIAEATHGSTAPELAAIFPTGKPGPDAPFVLQTLRFWNFFLLLAILTWLVELGLRRAKS